MWPTLVLLLICSQRYNASLLSVYTACFFFMQHTRNNYLLQSNFKDFLFSDSEIVIFPLNFAHMLNIHYYLCKYANFALKSRPLVPDLSPYTPFVHSGYFILHWIIVK